MKNSSESRRNKKIRKTIILLALVGIVLSVSTYAWFIGMKTVNVSKFDIDIATTEGLFLSMNGQDWSYNLDAKNAPAYTGNANQWLDGTKLGDDGKTLVPQGLIPMSSVGDMDETASRMMLYQKGSLSAVSNGGGARLLTSRVNNYTNKVKVDEVEYDNFVEGDGYVAFDLFIKNISGVEYYEANEPLNEEKIYLNIDSEVKVTSESKKNAGIENSIRIGFVQLGRVTAEEGKATVDTITGITCADDEAKGITGICRDAQIWEPNDTAHVVNAISYYNTNCKTRKETGTDVNASSSYDGACSTIADGTAYKTYAISREIAIADQVNIYDGAHYNSYATNTATYADYKNATDKSTMKLVDFPYFTDTMKIVRGVNREAFMTLAPNSITKLRVYIWLEGQDVDNYDFASLGESVTIKFGFTKEQLTDEDIPGYTGESTNITPSQEEEGGVNNPNVGSGD